MNITGKTKSDNTGRITPLYDAGGWFLIFLVFGIPLVGVIADYFWNYLILHFSLRWQEFSAAKSRKFIYCLIATAAGLIVDWLYYEITWGNLVLGSIRIPALFQHPGINKPLEFATILVPVAVLFLINFGLARGFFRGLTNRQTLVVGILMGIFTAPWIITAVVVLGG
ncbi:MAG: hypothetical protein NUV31_07950 [Dehalococcoidales bacterium]|jgi:hypothetical protein|nr:hypothetical protein [Dehalococcoidales bacterium]